MTGKLQSIARILLIAVLALVAGCATVRPPAASGPRARPSVPGIVVRIVDGDTLMIRIDGKIERVRLRRLNAPELDEPGGPEAKAALAQKFPPGAEVRVTIYARDVHGRIVGEVVKAKETAKETPAFSLLCQLCHGPEIAIKAASSAR